MFSVANRMEVSPYDIGRLKTLAVVVGLAVLVVAGCARQVGKAGVVVTEPQKPNEVVLYLDGAERQAETDEQRQEILRALEDMRTLDAATMKSRRYADEGNVPGKWTLAELLQKYFVPRAPHLIDEVALYRDTQSASAREVVEHQIRALREGRQVSPQP
jgi:hypothetical protein